MLVLLKEKCCDVITRAILELIESHNVKCQVIRSDKRNILGLVGPVNEALLEQLESNNNIEKIQNIKTPYKLASREFQSEDTVIKLNGVTIGGSDLALMAGPCAIESTEQLIETGLALKKSGVKILRASAYKPRTSPYSFQGLGEEGLKMHKRAQEVHGLLTETEVMDLRDVKVAAKYVDILRVGARNMQNYDLLKELGKCGKPVILKRGLSATVEEWLMSAEYIIAHGNPNVILCERGIRTFERATRNTLDISSVVIAKQLTHLPVIVDPSHAAGKKSLIQPLSMASVAAGADGLLIEVHYRPEESKCDKDQALSPEEFHDIVLDLQKLCRVQNKRLCLEEERSDEGHG